VFKCGHISGILMDCLVDKAQEKVR